MLTKRDYSGFRAMPKGHRRIMLRYPKFDGSAREPTLAGQNDAQKSRTHARRTPVNFADPIRGMCCLGVLCFSYGPRDGCRDRGAGISQSTRANGRERERPGFQD
ncbi:uncharacterized protein DFL_005748 [Arthrobotrys flagrans]|uniref:Uncharacterized protein n=1 Tax=Arthrobotrys flagrans TaxID=97331 RepID=A0A436ZYG1_ARTFL|nr:hypothetical protein DFL_005748 [Arthrobotrys flagrans]